MSISHDNTGPTIAQALIKTLDRIVETEAAAHHYGRRPPRGLSEAVDTACETLYDAEIERTEIKTFGGISKAERINISLPDGSHLTALASWSEDQIDLFDQRITDDSWYSLGDNGRRSTHGAKPACASSTSWKKAATPLTTYLDLITNWTCRPCLRP